jgi:hypothetical protein
MWFKDLQEVYHLNKPLTDKSNPMLLEAELQMEAMYARDKTNYRNDLVKESERERDRAIISRNTTK